MSWPVDAGTLTCQQPAGMLGGQFNKPACRQHADERARMCAEDSLGLREMVPGGSVNIELRQYVHSGACMGVC